MQGETEKGCEQTFGGDIIARCLDCDDGFLGVYRCLNPSSCVL